MRLLTNIVVCLIPLCTGCTALSQIPGRTVQKVTDFVHYSEKSLLSKIEIKDAERRALKEELDADREADLAVRLAEINAEKDICRQDQHYRAAALRAETEWRAEQLQNKFDDSVKTRVEMDIEQSFQFGTLQVDVEKLKKIMEERDKLYAAQLKEFENQQRMGNLRRLAQQANSSYAGQPQTAECAAPQITDNNCAQPPGLPNRAAQAPVKQPILPTEVPFSLPVSLRMETGPGKIGKTDVRRLPQKPACIHSDGASQRADNCTFEPRCDSPSPAQLPAACEDDQ